MSDIKNTALLLLGHGSSKHPESSRSVRMHADVLRERGRFSQVHCAFIKEDPLIEDALAQIDSAQITIVPDFLAEGYFTRQVIPKMLGELPPGVRYCDPVGTHPMMQELILKAASKIAGDWRPEETSLLLIGHGSTKNTNSQKTLLGHAQALRDRKSFVDVSDLWLEEEPFVKDWQQAATLNRVIAVPFLLSDGQHGGWDIPEMLGIEKTQTVHGITHRLGGKDLRMAPALGTTPEFVSVIEQVAMQARPAV